MEALLQKVRDFADQAHGEQTRKYTPERYIVHPERVMLICREYTTDIPVQAAALLHDVLEDTPVSKAKIASFLGELMSPDHVRRTVHLVEELTDVYIKKDYPHLNRKQRKVLETERLSKCSAAAQTIKYADLIDNAYDIIKHDPHFGRKYIAEAKALLKDMTKGNAELRERAIKTLDTITAKKSDSP